MDGQDPPIRVVGVDEYCSKRPYAVVCDQDPSLRYPASCDAYRCEVCGPRKALQGAAVAAWAIRHADRGRFIVATRAPDTHGQRRQKVRDFKRLLAREGYRCEWAWTTERGARTGMVHVNLLQHGDYVPQGLLQEMWGSIVHIQAVQTGGAAVYVTKDALRVAGYSVKDGVATPAKRHEYLDDNGGRAMHWSRGFLHGLTKREALAELRAELSGELRTWHLEPVCVGGAE